MKVLITARAESDLRQIQSYIAFDNITSARRVVEALRREIDALAVRGGAGRFWEGGLTRVVSVPKYRYRIHYELDEATETITVLTVWHTSRLPPEFL
jgi:plasmid stabilization system protein ParE